MSLDGFVHQYIGLLKSEINDCQAILATKDFEKMSDFTKVQGKLQGLQEALNLLKAIPEED